MTSASTAGLPLFQFNLQLERKPGSGPKVHPAEVDAFIRALYRKGWMTAAELGAATEKTKRVLRAVAEASKGHIISGQGGYRLAFEATADEHRAFVKWFKDQIAKMERRVIQTERVYHSKAIPDCLREQVAKDRHAA